MVRGDAEVGNATLEHLHHGAQDADDPTKGRIFALGEATQSVEMAEQLVRAVDKVNDHMAVWGAAGADWWSFTCSATSTYRQDASNTVEIGRASCRERV